MSEWLVRLKGHGFELEELSNHFRSPERNVEKDEDGHYYLRSSDFDPLADAEVVRERALELMEHMNWAARFHLGYGYRPVEFDVVTRINESGKRMHHITLTAEIEAKEGVRYSCPLDFRGGRRVRPSNHPDGIH